ncbi:hypothetical protein TNCV_4882121 [Trichonephila clavipes]|nr:hypothetical protein TNCV_4882121 [Trichonephila clavipes]
MFSMGDRSGDRADQEDIWQALTIWHNHRICRAVIECKKTTSCLLEASRIEYAYQNTARRTGIRLKRRHWASPVSIFVIRCTRESSSFSMLPCQGKPSNDHHADGRRLSLCFPVKGSQVMTTMLTVVDSLYAALSREAEVMTTMLTVINFLYGVRSREAESQGRSHDISVLLGVSYGKAWKSRMPFSMTLSNPLIPLQRRCIDTIPTPLYMSSLID